MLFIVRIKLPGKLIEMKINRIIFEAQKNIQKLFLIVLSLIFLQYPLFAGRDLKPEKIPESKRKCCPVGVSYMSGPGKVMLEKICNTKNRSVFYMKTYNLQSICTNPNGTILTDQLGRRYTMTGYKGIPHCKNEGFKKRSSKRFYWYFRKLKPAVKKINLVEVEDDITTGLYFWAWRNIDLSRCQF